MWTDKYAERRDELLHFRRNSSNLLTELDFLLQYGALRLESGMHWWKNVDNKPSFNPNSNSPPYPYDEKNLFVNASNNLWYVTMWRSYPAFSEIYFSTLLKLIKEFKINNNGFDFNKGIVYGNLGVAQSAQMKLDEGFANILKAIMEDAPYSVANPQQNFWKSPLFDQFEKQYVREPLQKIITGLNITGVTSVENFVKNFLNSLDDNQRTFFEYTFIETTYNYEIWREKENGLTANRLLAYTQDLCLFNEAFLKSKFANPDARWLLDDLIKKAGFRVSLKGCGATKMLDLDTKLSMLATSNEPRRCLRTLVTIRNYSSHNIGGGTSNNYFYAHYEDILKELIRAMCEIELLPKPITLVATP